jgi:hypothetical protein
MNKNIFLENLSKANVEIDYCLSDVEFRDKNGKNTGYRIAGSFKIKISYESVFYYITNCAVFYPETQYLALNRDLSFSGFKESKIDINYNVSDGGRELSENEIINIIETNKKNQIMQKISEIL